MDFRCRAVQVWPKKLFTSNITTVVIKIWCSFKFWVPVFALPFPHSVHDYRHEIIGISDIWKSPDGFKFLDKSGVVFLSNDNVIHRIGDELGILDTFLIGIDADGLKVIPVIVDGFNDTTGRNCS